MKIINRPVLSILTVLAFSSSNHAEKISWADATSDAVMASPARRWTPSAILDHVDDLFRGTSSHGKLTMNIVSARYTRELALEQWSSGKTHSLVRILSPKKERGTSTLRISSSIWNYLPKVDRVVKVPSSLMSNGWMGSHFTNDDLVRASRMADDYTNVVSFQGERHGQKVIELTLTPKRGAAVVWSKVVVTVRAADATPLNITYYGDNNALARTQIFSNVGSMGKRILPRTVRVVPADKSGEYTEITYEDVAFDTALAESIFTVNNLKK